MAEMVSNLRTAERARLRSLVVPREHGAWGKLLVPLAIGGAVGLRSADNLAPFLSLTLAAVALFWMRTPVEALLGTTVMKARTTQERQDLLIAVLALGSIAVLCLVGVFWNGRNLPLLPIGCLAVAAFGVQALVKRLGRKGRMPAQLIGTIGLTSTSAAAFIVANGRWEAVAISIWLLNFAFAANQVHYVQTRIHTSRETELFQVLYKGDALLFGQVFLLALLAAGCYCGFLPWFAMVAFAPLLIRGFALFVRRPGPLNIHRLGWTELANAVVFAVLLSAAYWNH